MKKVSAKLFFAVLCKGMKQTWNWFMGLFGYQRNGSYATCVWRLFATSATIIVTIVAMALVWAIGETAYEKYYKETYCYDPDCYHAEFISENVYFHDRNDGKGYVFNCLTSEKTLKHVAWIARPAGKDSLVCFSDGTKRGYFSKNTGKVVIEPQYNHAWIFSEGIASVEIDGYIKFIDSTGKIVIDNGLPYFHGMDGYVFHGGYCVIYGDGKDVIGLVDRAGKIVLPCEYNAINLFEEDEAWHLVKGKEQGVLDKELNTVIPMTECSLSICNGAIDMTMPNHTMRRYDLKGHLINDFYVSDFRMLEYQKEEILYRYRTHDEDGSEYAVPFVESYHPKATARLRAYVAGDGYEGLMTAEGHVVTKPLYRNVEAMAYDLYLCEEAYDEKVVVNGKGEIVR